MFSIKYPNQGHFLLGIKLKEIVNSAVHIDNKTTWFEWISIIKLIL